MAWLEGWTYRREINVANSSANVELNLTVGESANASADVHLNEHSADFPSAKGDGGDLRFADENANLRPFWVESVSGAAPDRVANVWVKLGSSNLFIYYGNANANNAANGDDTFVFFDDFPGTSLDSNKWTVLAGGANVANSIVTVSAANSAEIRSLTGIDPPYGCRFYANASEYDYGKVGTVDSGNFTEWAWWGCSNTANNRLCSVSGLEANRTSNLATWQILDIKASNNENTKFYVDNTLDANIGTNPYDTQYLYMRADSGYETKCDYCFIRLYTDPEPSVASEGNEEQYSPPSTSNGSFFPFFL